MSKEIGSASCPKTSEQPKDIADALNMHFTNIAKTLAEKLKPSNHKHTDFMGTANRSSIYLRPIELQEILDLI